MALIWVWTTMKNVSLPKWLGVGLTIIFLFFAFFNAWREQYLKTHPGLRIEIQELGLAPDQDNPETTKVFAIVSIANLGSPSIADSFQLSMKMPDSSNEITVQPYMFDPNKPITLSDSNGSVEYSGSDALYLKTSGQPIQTGGKMTGIVSFRIPSISYEKSSKTGVSFTLECKDISGNLIKQTRVWKSGNDTKLSDYYPGLTPPNYTPSPHK